MKTPAHNRHELYAAVEKHKSVAKGYGRPCPDWTTAEADKVFAELKYQRLNGTTYPKAWSILASFASAFPDFGRKLDAAVRKHVA
jgi:hypothetical protein